MVGQAARLHPTAPGDGFLHTRLLLLPSGDPPGGADVATVPPGEGPVVDDLGVHNDLDASIKEGHDLKMRTELVARFRHRKTLVGSAHGGAMLRQTESSVTELRL